MRYGTLERYGGSILKNTFNTGVNRVQIGRAVGAGQLTDIKPINAALLINTTPQDEKWEFNTKDLLLDAEFTITTQDHTLWRVLRSFLSLRWLRIPRPARNPKLN